MQDVKEGRRMQGVSGGGGLKERYEGEGDAWCEGGGG